MANVRNTYQQAHTVSIQRDALTEIALDSELSGKDIRVLLILLTQLDGFSIPDSNRNVKDPLNYKKVDISAIADVLSLKKKDVKKSINWIHDLGYLEIGSNDTVKDGYRFTF